jgi:flagellar hook-length control protein FliK
MPVKLAAPLNAAGAFERLDSAAAPQTIASTPQRLTVGVQSAGLGWVEIHAHTTQGLVSATLATGSVESHHAVSAQLPWIRESLSGAQVRVGDLTSEVFSAPSRNREGSQQDQPQSGGGDSRKTTGQEERPARASMEAEVEALSYINVRV